jgi:hypothetical protein
MEAAIKIDAAAWERFSKVEAERIKAMLGLPDNGGIPALKKPWYRLYRCFTRGS